MTAIPCVSFTAPAELCASTAGVWKDSVIKSFADHAEEASIDLSNTRFIDSSGLGVLLSLNKAMRGKGGSLKLLKPSAAVSQLIELTRLHRVFDIVHS